MQGFTYSIRNLESMSNYYSVSKVWRKSSLISLKKTMKYMKEQIPQIMSSFYPLLLSDTLFFPLFFLCSFPPFLFFSKHFSYL